MAIPSWLKRMVLADLSPKPEAFSLGTWEQGAEPAIQPSPQASTVLAQVPDNVEGKLTTSLEENVRWIKQAFHLALNRGMVLRPLRIGEPPIDAMVIYMDDQVDWEHLNRAVLTPLLREPLPREIVLSPTALVREVLTEGRVATSGEWQTISDAILAGSAILLIDGVGRAISLEVKGWAMRSVERPNAEMTVRGPQESFTEDIRCNLSLVRKRLRTPDLIIEWGQLGRISRTDVALLYLKSVANPSLVDEVRRRIRNVDIDFVTETGTLEQLIEDHPWSIYPNIAATERPDRAAAQIAEGYVVVIVAGGSFALILPSNIPMFIHSPEDAYLRWPYASFIRLFRTSAFFLALLLPGLYTAVANFHHEMIPTSLMLAISGTRETVPLPIVGEVLFMEAMFELIREAGVRIPSVMGPTIGIVGALILGQAAVQAGVISPIMVIITSATALASFAIPNYSLQYAVRILRFVYILAASVLGLFGVMLLFLVLSFQGAAKLSFGTPWFSPVTPLRGWGDTMIRLPSFLQQKRPESVRPQDSRRQAQSSRPWAPDAPLRRDKEGDNGPT